MNSAPGRCHGEHCGSKAEKRGKWCTRHYRELSARGVVGYRDATNTATRLRKLRDLDWTWDEIADEACLSSKRILRRVAAGDQLRVQVETEEAILGLPLERRRRPRRGVDSTGMRRRVQALAWLGWPVAEIAVRAGTTERSLGTQVRPDRRPSRQFAERVAAVYEDLCMTPGPSRIAAAKARAKGWAPPLAWDDIDDPAATPKGALR